MSELTLAMLWDRLVERPGHCFLSAPGREVSYADLGRLIRAELARFDSGGLAAGSRVLILVEDEVQAIAAFIAGATAPPGRRMGHAGAIIGGADDTAAAKKRILAECGIAVSDSPADMAATLLKRWGK